MALIASVPNATIKPAMIRPIVIKGMEVFGRMPKTWATREPVQPPLPGRGTATNVMRARCPSSLMRLLCFVRVLWKSQLKKRFMNLKCLRRNLVAGGRR